jgi:hypothetical protein
MILSWKAPIYYNDKLIVHTMRSAAPMKRQDRTLTICHS